MMGQGFRALTLAAVCMVTVAWCDAVAAPMKLELKLEKGKTYYQRTVTDQRITQTIMGQQQVIEQSVGNGMKLEVLGVDSQGNMRVRNTFIWSMFRQNGPMGNTEYDSSKQTTPPAGSEPLAALLGQSYVVTLSPRGQVLDVNGVEELKEAVHKRLPPGGDQSQMMMAVAPYLDKQGVKEMVEGMLAFYPDKAVEPGDSWSEKMTLTAGFGMIVEHKWTLQKRQAGVAILAQTAAIRTNPDAPLMDAGGMKMKFDLSGTQEGVIHADEATGLLLTNEGRQHLQGEMKLAMSADTQPMMAIPSVFDTTFKVETSDKIWKTDAR